MKVPVIFIIFNKPEETQKVFDRIREYKPEKLLVISDGPGDPKTLSIIDRVDWPCEVLKKYSDTNMGARKTLSTGLTWAFQKVDRAVVFEADCLPHPSFFTFCEELLEKYKDDEQIMHISGNFFQHANKNFSSKDSYYFSSVPHIWGWASWARAWKHYDPDIKKWPEIKKSGILKSKLGVAAYEYWETVWDGYYSKKINSWDGQWTFACMINNGLSINPTKNLVTNIGFNINAMQTKDENSIFAHVPLEAMPFPLVHPANKEVYKKADEFTWKQNFGINRKISQRILGPIRRKFPKPYALIRKLFK